MLHIFKIIRLNFLSWTYFISKSFLVSYLSYYLFKFTTGTIFLKDLQFNERYYLSYYAFMQVIVAFVFYKGVGELIEIYLNYWIKKNESEISINVEKQDKKEITKMLHFCFSIIVYFELLSIQELDQLDEIPNSEEEHNNNWKKTTEIVKNTAGFVILCFMTAFITWEANALFLTLGIVISILILGSVMLLLAYYFTIKNLHLINTFIQSYNTSTRIIKKTNK